MLHFYAPWDYQETRGFLMFSSGIAREHWPVFSEHVNKVNIIQ